MSAHPTPIQAAAQLQARAVFALVESAGVCKAGLI